MHGAEGLQQCCVSECGKVPYRLVGAFRPVRPFGPGVDYGPARPYKHKGLELQNSSTEAHSRKRKKEGLNLIFGFVRPGCTGAPLTGNERFHQ
jgi:hypothetical protein